LPLLGHRGACGHRRCRHLRGQPERVPEAGHGGAGRRRPVKGRRVPLYGWLTAEAISLLGTRVSMIAIPWLVLVTTGSATRTGLVSVAELTPLVLFKATGGPLVDRV